MREFFIDNKVMKTRVHQWGSKDNPTIICLHGLGSTSLSFLEIAEILKNSFHIISIDLPGHGKTSSFTSDKDYGIPNLTKWLSGVIESLHQKEFYLLAHSWGGDVALHYTSEFPHKIKKVVLLDGGYYTKDDVYKISSKLNEEGKFKGKSSCSMEDEIAYYEKDFDEYIFSNWDDFIDLEKTMYLRWNPILEQVAKDLMKEENGKLKFRASGDTARGAIKSMNNYPTKDIYDKLSNNILLLISTLPESWLKIRNILSENFRDSTNGTVKKIENTTHMIHWDKPKEIVEEIVNWFK